MFRQRNISNKSTSSNRSTSSESIKTKYVKEMALPFLMDKMLNDTDAKYIILQRYYDTLRYELTTDLQKIIPYDNEQFTDNAVYLALNPRIYPFIPELIERIRNNPEKLKVFYHNLAKNKNPKVMPYLKTIYYEIDPGSDKLNWINLSGNKNAIRILKREYEKKPNNLVWSALCKNPNAIKILEKEYVRVPNNLVWDALCENPKAIPILTREYEKNPNNLVWDALCENPKAIPILTREYEKNPNNLVWSALCKNPEAIPILEKEYKKNPNNLVWDALCKNPEAIPILKKEYKKKNPNNLVWDALCKNPEAIPILEKEYAKDPNNLVWDALCENTKAYNILKYEMHRELNWSILSGNVGVGVIRLLNDKKKTGIVDGMFESRNINWDILSGNTKAIKLIIYKINDERINPLGSTWEPKGLLNETDMYINWKRLSQNPSIFTINGLPEIENDQ